ncbi:MAG: pyridoxal phosphate-dependent aminotransferase [Gammaproteobacteria bacterium]|nr:pyridoxal phosphate-dependent aminotransferase [Gammaproteobacteria bacterium]
MTQISKRGAALGTENAFVVLAEVERLRSAGKDIVSFCIGQPDISTPAHICEAAIQAIKDGHTGYTPSAGIQPLRNAVANYINRTRKVDVDADDVICGCGAKPFIGYTIQAVTDHNVKNEVIYPVPGFPIYESQIRANGAIPVALPLRKNLDFHFDLEELADRINSKTRLIIINSPHNPTGVVFDRNYLEKLAEIIAPWENLWVLSDEPYYAFVYEQEFVSIASIKDMLERTVIVDSVSKTYSMTGWRVGYAVNKKLAPVFSRMVTNTDSCAPHPNQYAALTALSGNQDSVENMRNKFRSRRDHIVDGLNSIPGIQCRLPEGAFYAWPDVTELCEKAGIKDSVKLAERLLHEAGVAVLADAHFGSPLKVEGQHLRFSYACPLKQIDLGLQRIRNFVQSLL